MRPIHAVVPLALLLSVAATTSSTFAQSRKVAAGAQRRGKPPAKPAPAPSAEGTGSDNPYGGEAGRSEAQAPAAAPAAPEASAPSTPVSSGDPKLDEPPPPATAESTGPKPSPLTPRPDEMAKGPPAPGPELLDRLMSDIAALRARVASLTTSLFSSKLRIGIQTEGDDARILSLVVTLDDGVVFQSGAGFVADERKIVYEHAVAPGSHVVGIEIERQDARGATYRTWQTSRFSVQVPERKTLEASVEVEDESDMAEDFPDDQDGEYELAIRLRAAVPE